MSALQYIFYNSSFSRQFVFETSQRVIIAAQILGHFVLSFVRLS